MYLNIPNRFSLFTYRDRSPKGKWYEYRPDLRSLWLGSFCIMASGETQSRFEVNIGKVTLEVG